MTVSEFGSCDDVSCRVTGYGIQHLLDRNLPTAHLADGLACSLDDLRSTAATISWGEYLRFYDNLRSQLTESQWRDICGSYSGSRHIRPLLAVAGPWFDPIRFFEWAASPDGGAMSQLFRCIDMKIDRIDSRIVLIEQRLRPGYAMPPASFWEGVGLGFAALTTYFGLERSEVSWEPIDRGAAFRVVVPRRRSVKSLGRWLASWLRRETSEDLQTALSHGHARSLRLEQDVEARRRVELALRESEERFRTLIDHAPEAIILYDADTDRFDLANRNAEELFGMPRTELSKYGLLDLSPERQPDGAVSRLRGEQLIADALDGKTPQFEWTHLNARGESILCEVRLVRLPSESRRLLRGSLIDITERKRAEAERREAQEFLETALTQSSAGIVIASAPDGKIIVANPAAVRMRGGPKEHLTDIGIAQHALRWQVSRPDGSPFPSEELPLSRAVLGGETVLGEEAVIRDEFGSDHWVIANASPIRNSRGEITHGIVVFNDITERKQIDKSLAEKEERFRTYVDHSPVGVFVADEQGRYIDANPAALKMVGYDREELLTRSITDLTDPNDRTVAQEAFAQLVKTGSNQVELSLLHKSGASIWTSVRSVRIAGERFVGFVIDLSESRRAQQILRETENRHRLALDAALMGTWDWDITRNRVLCDPQEAILFGYSPGEHWRNDQEFFGLIHPADLPKVRADIAKCVEAGASFQAEFRIKLPDGQQRWLAGRGLVIRDIKGLATRLVGINYDITERKEAESFMAESLLEKEAMLKEIHHRVKNNLQVVSSLLNLQAEQIADPEMRTVFLESQQRVRAMALVHETLYGSESLAGIELPSYIQRLCDSLAQSFSGSDRIAFRREVADITLDLDRALPVGLIVGELVSNALKYAFPNAAEGTIRVSIQVVGEDVELSVSDDGVGLPANFSVERSETLGLFLVKVLTRQLRGELSIDPTAGASFTIRFPK